MDSLLETRDLTSFYGDFQALFGIDFDVHEGETVAVIGANGAGKTTFLKTICGLLAAPREAVRFQGESIGSAPAGRIVAKGVAMVPEGRRLFASLSVEENLLMGAYSRRAGPWSLARVYEVFPALAQRRRHPAPALSGGEQQMVAIGRALMSNPKLLICDELSLGLAPIVIKNLYDTLPRLRAEGLTLIIVEQDVSTAMRVADRLYCFQEGRVSLTGKSSELATEQISKAYFGV
jgi:branched-chain amino acid transport system ATP-binding protein